MRSIAQLEQSSRDQNVIQLRQPSAHPPQSKLEAALALVARGFRVHPCEPGGKKPMVNAWQYAATTDESRIRQWWVENPDYNPGTPCDGELVIDLDPKKNGIENFKHFLAAQKLLGNELPKTLTAGTPSGGMHLRYKLPPPGVAIRNGVDVLGPGIDIRTTGGYVVAPGARHKNGNRWWWSVDIPEAVAPDWLIAECQAKRQKSSAAGERVATASEDDLACAENWVRQRAPAGDPGNVDNSAYQVAARMYDFGLELSDVRDMLLLWAELHCYRDLTDDELDRISKSAGRNRQNTIGSMSENAPGFEVLAVDESRKPKRIGQGAPKSESEQPASPGGPTEGVLEDGVIPTAKNLILSMAAWKTRALSEPDFILGNWLSTTSRAYLYAPTGLGKTMVALALGMAIAAGNGFLHWQGRRKAGVLYIDGEMSSRLLKQRLLDEMKRRGDEPDTFFALSHEDITNFAPLNTLEGQKAVEAVIKQIGGVDYIIFDNIMSLISGDQKDEEGWRQISPWVRSLTNRRIGQLWVHHTGHNSSHAYGTKTREWEMDTVLALQKVERAGVDVSFKAVFEKARERTPATRADFKEVAVALIDDKWQLTRGEEANFNVPLTLEGQAVVSALKSLQEDSPGVPGFTVATIRAASADKMSGHSQKALRRLLGRLDTSGHIETVHVNSQKNLYKLAAADTADNSGQSENHSGQTHPGV